MIFPGPDFRGICPRHGVLLSHIIHVTRLRTKWVALGARWVSASSADKPQTASEASRAGQLASQLAKLQHAAKLPPGLAMGLRGRAQAARRDRATRPGERVNARKHAARRRAFREGVRSGVAVCQSSCSCSRFFSCSSAADAVICRTVRSATMPQDTGARTSVRTSATEMCGWGSGWKRETREGTAAETAGGTGVLGRCQMALTFCTLSREAGGRGTVGTHETWTVSAETTSVGGRGTEAGTSDRALSRGRWTSVSCGTEIFESCLHPASQAACAAIHKREISRLLVLGTEGLWMSSPRLAIADRMAWGRGEVYMAGVRAGAAAVDTRSYLPEDFHLDASGAVTSRGVSSSGVHLSRTDTTTTGTAGTGEAGGTSLLCATGPGLAPGTCETFSRRERGKAATCGAYMMGGMKGMGWRGAM